MLPKLNLGVREGGHVLGAGQILFERPPGASKWPHRSGAVVAVEALAVADSASVIQAITVSRGRVSVAIECRR